MLNRSSFLLASGALLASCAGLPPGARSVLPRTLNGTARAAALRKTATGWDFLARDGSVVGAADSRGQTLTMAFRNGRRYSGRRAASVRRVSSEQAPPKFAVATLPGIMLYVPLGVTAPSYTLLAGGRTITGPIAPSHATTQSVRHAMAGACNNSYQTVMDPNKLDPNMFSDDPQSIDPILMATAAFGTFVDDAIALGVPTSLVNVTGTLSGTVDSNGAPTVQTDWTVSASIPGLTDWLNGLSQDSMAILNADLGNILFWGYMANCF